METDRARRLLLDERGEVKTLLRGTLEAGSEDREAEVEQAETGDASDSAQPLTAQGMDDSIADTLRDRLAAIDRALKRLDDGTYGRSVRSGEPIPDERLEADPAAELTVAEAGQERLRAAARPSGAYRPLRALNTSGPKSVAVAAKPRCPCPSAPPDLMPSRSSKVRSAE